MEREDPEHGAAVAVARRTVRHPTELTDPAVEALCRLPHRDPCGGQDRAERGRRGQRPMPGTGRQRPGCRRSDHACGRCTSPIRSQCRLGRAADQFTVHVRMPPAGPWRTPPVVAAPSRQRWTARCALEATAVHQHVRVDQGDHGGGRDAVPGVARRSLGERAGRRDVEVPGEILRREVRRRGLPVLDDHDVDGHRAQPPQNSDEVRAAPTCGVGSERDDRRTARAHGSLLLIREISRRRATRGRWSARTAPSGSAVGGMCGHHRGARGEPLSPWRGPVSGAPGPA